MRTPRRVHRAAFSVGGTRMWRQKSKCARHPPLPRPRTAGRRAGGSGELRSRSGWFRHAQPTNPCRSASPLPQVFLGDRPGEGAPRGRRFDACRSASPLPQGFLGERPGEGAPRGRQFDACRSALPLPGSVAVSLGGRGRERGRPADAGSMPVEVRPPLPGSFAVSLGERPGEGTPRGRPFDACIVEVDPAATAAGRSPRRHGGAAGARRGGGR